MSDDVTVKKADFGETKDGQKVYVYTFSNKNGLTIRIINFGAYIKDVLVPDKNGKCEDINLGFDDLEGYETDPWYLGAVIGRVANRIAGGEFTIDGQTYKVTINDIQGNNNIVHGGKKGFNKVVWEPKIEGNKLVLKYISKDGEEGFPGDVTAIVTYELTSDNELIMDMSATTTKPTPVDLTNHALFNLAGHNGPPVNDHVVTVKADTYHPVDDSFIPTGEVPNVEGTLFDLRTPVKLGSVMSKIEGGIGFAHYYCTGAVGEKKFTGRVDHPPSGRFMEMHSTTPGVVLYTGYFTDIPKGKCGAKYSRYAGVLFEPTLPCDAVHHPHFGDTILRPGQTYRSTTWYKFGATS